MRKIKTLQDSFTKAVIISLMIFVSSCDRTDYDLFDPSEAGVWTVFDTSDGLPANRVADIKLDSRDNLWLTFPDQGIAKFRDGLWTYYQTANSLLLNNSVSCLAEGIDGSIIFGTATGVSILSQDNTWDSYLDPVTSMVVQSIKVASNGSVWVGTTDQGFYVNNGSGFVKTYSEIYKKINVIEEDAAGNIWLGTDNGLIKWNGTGYSYMSTLDGLPDNKISSLRRDSKERLWIGTNGGNKVSWIDRKGLHHMSLLNGKDSSFINDIFEDRNGNIWFATASDGLVKFDGIIPRTYNVLNGFPENIIHSIGEDKSGNLWFGLDTKGVVRYTLPIE